ncbi:NAD(P)/FAD-dependent oxidoreductase [Candidatus Dependentiae bacterium]|nr:NAD(P)/FAD-dependent oxidoreductase [Candidatus Dependentiae bacterium]
MKVLDKKKAVIIGAGPAGLTAALELLKRSNIDVTILERDTVVGGLAKTVEYKKCRYDIGPHHFITESERVTAWWQEIAEGDFFQHKRYTRIYYNRHFFNYPLEPVNVIRGLNLIECARSIFSYIWVRFFPIKEVASFEDWVTNQFGHRLFSIFFKTYTEKVWGIPCNEISADWAAQRIKGFSLSKAIFYAFFGRFFSSKNKPRTINDIFHYPARGAGTFWEKVAARVTSYPQAAIHLQQNVTRIEHDHHRIISVSTHDLTASAVGAAVPLIRYEADDFLSTMPLQQLILNLHPLPPKAIIKAAQALRYRGLITINLIVGRPHVSADHWIYVHEKTVRMGRIGNMNNFSLKMVDDPAKHTALSLEYFTYVDEPFWFKPDYELIELAKYELEKIGLVRATAVIDGMVLRTPEAYPVYDANYKEHLNAVLGYLSTFKNLHLMGRNGMHRYNNMDVAMLSALDVVDRMLVEQQPHINEPPQERPSAARL